MPFTPAEGAHWIPESGAFFFLPSRECSLISDSLTPESEGALSGVQGGNVLSGIPDSRQYTSWAIHGMPSHKDLTGRRSPMPAVAVTDGGLSGHPRIQGGACAPATCPEAEPPHGLLLSWPWTSMLISHLPAHGRHHPPPPGPLDEVAR